jgi:putative spermidine/putrescine transport system permease protein
VLPNLRTAVLSASFLSVALVLGEFTIASLFSKKNLQVAMYELGKSDAKISVAVGLVSLVFAFVVLFAMSFVGSSPAGTSPLARLRRTRADRKEPAA